MTAMDVRVLVRTLLEEAHTPLLRALLEAQQRISELERRMAAAPSGGSACGEAGHRRPLGHPRTGRRGRRALCQRHGACRPVRDGSTR